MKTGRTYFGLGRALALASLLIGPMVAQAAVTVALSASNLTPVAGGGAFGYTVTLANPDAGAATNVVMTLPLPSGIEFANLSVSGAQAGAFSCTGPGVGDNGSVVCRSASFVAGGAATVDVVVTTDANLAGGIRTATARVVSGGNQNFANRQITVQNNAALSLIVAATDSAAPGTRAALLVTINSNGFSSAINGVLSMILPSEVQFASLYGTGPLADACSYNPDSREVRCSMDDVPTGIHALTLNLDLVPNQPNGNAQFSVTLTTSVGSVNGSPALASIAISP